MFSKVLILIYIPTRYACQFKMFQVFVNICQYIYFNHFGGYVLGYHYAFNLHFPGD